MAEHIDCDRLNNDLRYRFEYLSKFLNFTINDITMLNTFSSIVLPVIPVIVDSVYRKLFSFDITKEHFLIHNEKFIPKKTIPSDTLESTDMTFRKDMLTMYLRHVLAEHEWNDTFLQYLSQVGKMHTNQAGLSSINIDYIHINVLLGYLQQTLIDILCNADNIDEINKHGILIAINKLFWIQNEFFTMHYFIPLKDDAIIIQTPPLTKKSKCCWM
ncbi:unnamed protein product [Adineta steineri]|uniref:Globin-sensor domain-containing protein n=1 Tax=Adineta steineri TaxID=433720 RepID=A0A814PB58_9BILA|nr:unnamed protein product [Adineta steineri]CAF1103732.1 unnamed protein product [Adineta steineri]CAF3781310.1 unnamed protein product [Adineta steineri]CAF4084865.1 unnamed protein product [Adineta steineri]